MIDTLKITNAVVAQIHAGDDVPVIPAFSAQDDFNPAGTVSVELQAAELMTQGTEDWRITLAVYARTLTADDPDLSRIAALSGAVLRSVKNLDLEAVTAAVGHVAVATIIKVQKTDLIEERRVSSLEFDLIFSGLTDNQ